ncbi:50S ribosomal protein L24 [Methylacidiphilum caldifontis]|uniref:Large ribosomal subunit protein uL24 n=1 Tax=Methylacidiphilum caldifontis TaxID=2795386 RepID=A0A4Y8P6P4_9BACT|nr:50S ribosomal protein L24 [Methylacidiphilum caldifontis]QSR89310.1 50S ribosomal protein L24 [Methylacidiphilum caldifontis]TFE65710.1 50S ribosomal protein L24 [Methylacidiphilum caldifontis]
MNKRNKRKNLLPLKKSHVKRGDEVVVITGSERGKRGKVIKVLRENHKVVVEGVKIIKKAVRPSQNNPQGGIVEREAAISISNVMLASKWEKKQEKKKGQPKEET